MHDGGITVRIDLNIYYILIIMNFSSCLRKSFILIEFNSSYFL
jgi:hypothetical protein